MFPQAHLLNTHQLNKPKMTVWGGLLLGDELLLGKSKLAGAISHGIIDVALPDYLTAILQALLP